MPFMREYILFYKWSPRVWRLLCSRKSQFFEMFGGRFLILGSIKRGVNWEENFALKHQPFAVKTVTLKLQFGEW